MPWVVDVAEGMGMPCALLWVQSCADFSMFYHFHHLSPLPEFAFVANGDVDDFAAIFSLLGMPELRVGELNSFLVPPLKNLPITKAMAAQMKNLTRLSQVLVNSFEELNGEAVRGIMSPCVITHVGPLLEVEHDHSHHQQPEVKGSMWKAEEDECMKWLDSQEPSSVVYVSMGSVVVLSKAQKEEMAIGLRNTGRPFLWVVKGKESRELLPSGFMEEEMKKGSGLVADWSRQEQVVAHTAVGCVVTHCGWNNAKFLTELLKVGVHMRRVIGNGEVMGPIGRGDVERCAEEVIGEGEARRSGTACRPPMCWSWKSSRR